jgi:hypothetical protein
MRFSERYGFTPVRTAIQSTSMDADLRTSLWNTARLIFLKSNEHALQSDKRLWRIARASQIQFFKAPLDDLPYTADDYIELIKEWLFSAKWFQVYDYVEHLGNVLVTSTTQTYSSEYETSEFFRKQVNIVLEKEKSGYRFVGTNLAPIVGEAELASIESALDINDKFSGARSHIRTALQLYSDRRNPDYRNTIKEAISAIESAACIITGDSKATLGQALKVIEKNQKIHPAMTTAFDKLYGYTSNSGGIRHSMLEEETVGEQEALFMLVACSAFLNYLVGAVPK